MTALRSSLAPFAASMRDPDPANARRAARDAKRAEAACKNGKNGGNPNLRKQSGNPAWDNPPVKGSDKGGVKAQRPEARGQRTPLPPKGGAACSDLPDWVPAEPWAGFEEMRKRIRKPLSDRARSLAVTELGKLRDAGHDPGAVLDQSTFHSWQGLFPLKGDERRQSGPYAPHGDFLDHRLAQRRQREEWERSPKAQKLRAVGGDVG